MMCSMAADLGNFDTRLNTINNDIADILQALEL
jgi:hypothetical protein